MWSQCFQSSTSSLATKDIAVPLNFHNFCAFSLSTIAKKKNLGIPLKNPGKICQHFIRRHKMTSALCSDSSQQHHHNISLPPSLPPSMFFIEWIFYSEGRAKVIVSYGMPPTFWLKILSPFPHGTYVWIESCLGSPSRVIFQQAMSRSLVVYFWFHLRRHNINWMNQDRAVGGSMFRIRTIGNSLTFILWFCSN